MKVKNQAQFEKALAKGERDFDIVGDAELRVTIDELVTLRTYGSSQPRVEASGSSQPRVVASGHVQLSTAGAVSVEVKPDSHVTVLAEGDATIDGTPAHVTRKELLSSIEGWCQEYGVPIVDGVVVLYKAVNDQYRSGYDFDYTPGSTPIAADWDGGQDECGKGLHFAPRPVMALGFNREATKFVACPIALADIRAPQPDDSHPTKVKARGCCGPVFEVDIDGDALVPATEAVPA